MLPSLGSQFGAVGMPLSFALVALSFGLYLLWRLSVREAAEHQPHDASVPLPQSAMLADEASLYSDDNSIVWEDLVNAERQPPELPR